MSCPVCGQPVTRPRARYCSPACYAATQGRSRRSAPLWINRVRQDAEPARPAVRSGHSLRAAVRASDLRPTPAQLLEAWRRIREAGR